MRPTRAEVDLAAVAHNVTTLRALAPDSAFLAVVKADGYGHGATAVADAAVGAGAAWLGVATVDEGAALREAGRVEPVLLLSQPVGGDLVRACSLDLTPTVYTEVAVAAADAAGAAAGRVWGVHLKVDTGMHRVGCSPDDVVGLAEMIEGSDHLALEGYWTHFAVADEPDDPRTAGQLSLFHDGLRALHAAGVRPAILHAANSAATMAHPAAHMDLVRCGIAMYGIAPAPVLEGTVALRPALRLVSAVTHVRDVAGGVGVSYGLGYRTAGPARLATVPAGYADGVPRRLGQVGGEVLVRGRRRPIAGVVTMDQFVVDCGDEAVEVGDEVVLLGRQGDEVIAPNDWGALLDTIGYEIVCRLTTRVPRVLV